MSMLQGSDGKLSVMRVCSFIVVLTVMAVFLAHNIISMANGGVFVSLGYSEMSLIALTLGAKATQSFAEAGANKDTPPTTDALPIDKKE